MNKLSKSTAAITLVCSFASAAFAAGITAPDTIDRGETVSITVVDPGTSTRIELWGPVTQTGKGQQITASPVEGGAATLTFDLPAGSYLLRHVGQNGGMIAAAPIDISAAPVALSVATPVDPQAGVAVTWRGPAAEGDVLRLIDPQTGTTHSATAVNGTLGTENQSTIAAPAKKGVYDLQYVSAEGSVLRSVQVEVSEGLDWLRSPLGVATGQRFVVSWRGGVRADHVFRMARTDGSALAEVPLDPKNDTPASAVFKAPEQPGQYLMQLVDVRTGNVVTSLPLDVDA